jgi:hypothetical protein
VIDSGDSDKGATRNDMNIRIVKRPFGEAPEEVRDAWIGLLIPVLPRYSRLRERHCVGVLSGPQSWVLKCFLVLTGRSERKRGYIVDAAAAIELLESANLLAATWWRTNTPYLLKAGQQLFFDAECRD